MVAQVARVLRPGGVYLANCADRPPLAGARAEVATLRAAFADVAVIAEPGLLRGRGYGNVVLAATDDPDLLGSRGAGPRRPQPPRARAAAARRRGHRVRGDAPRPWTDPRGMTKGRTPCGMRPFARSSDQIGRTLSACGPLAPCVISNSTRWPSSRLR